MIYVRTSLTSKRRRHLGSVYSTARKQSVLVVASLTDQQRERKGPAVWATLYQVDSAVSGTILHTRKVKAWVWRGGISKALFYQEWNFEIHLFKINHYSFSSTVVISNFPWAENNLHFQLSYSWSNLFSDYYNRLCEDNFYNRDLT